MVRAGGIGVSDLATATLRAVFIYWGWDTAVACNEETANPDTTPGRAAILSTLLLLGVTVTVAAVAFAGVGTKGIGLGDTDNADDVFKALGPTVFGKESMGSVFESLLVIPVLTSASASTQTTMLPTARTALSMGAYRAIPRKFAAIHPRYLTPTWATVGMGLVSIAFSVVITIVKRQHPGRLDRRRRTDDRVLLRHDWFRLRLVLPPRPAQRQPQHADEGHPAVPGRSDPVGGVPQGGLGLFQA